MVLIVKGQKEAGQLRGISLGYEKLKLIRQHPQNGDSPVSGSALQGGTMKPLARNSMPLILGDSRINVMLNRQSIMVRTRGKHVTV